LYQFLRAPLLPQYLDCTSPMFENGVLIERFSIKCYFAT